MGWMLLHVVCASEWHVYPRREPGIKNLVSVASLALVGRRDSERGTSQIVVFVIFGVGSRSASLVRKLAVG
jgi:hypothetical protein